MNRKLSVFILLILLASSFKYKAKSLEAMLPAKAINPPVAPVVEPKPAKPANPDFSGFVVELQKANQEFASGNPEPFKALWSRSDDVTALGKTNERKAEGWRAVEIKLDSDSKAMPVGNEYSFENITTQVGQDLACLLQVEHYRLPNEQPIDLRVTILLRKEAEGWKIIHRHAENIK